MARLKEALDWRFWILQPIFGILIPYLINLTALTVNVKIIGSLFIVNMLFSVYAGAFLRKRGAFWFLLFVWPIVFMVSIWLGINSMMYGYYLAALYLVIELFAFTRGQEEEVDVEDQIPVDGGFREV